MEIRYRREIRHNYLIIKMDGCEEDYEMRMAEENCVGGFLPFLVKESGDGKEFYYEITSRQPLSRMAERRPMSGEELRHLILGIAGAVTEMEKFLLSEGNILLEPDYIYIEPQNYTVSLCFVPGYGGDFPAALGKLMEYLLGKVSHDDRGGVVLAYELFQATRQENYGIRDLLRILYQPDHENRELEETDFSSWEDAEERRPPRGLPETEKSAQKRRGLFERFKKKKEEEIPWQAMFPEDRDERIAEPEPDYQSRPLQEEDTALLQNRPGRAERRLVSLSGDEEIEIPYFPFLLGKQEGLVDHVVARDTVSRLHARIDRENGAYTVTDLNSTNGVRVDGRLLQTNETVPLPVGSEIYLADAGFLFL